jgi:hypothetical protein
MSKRYASGRKALGECAKSGRKMLLNDMVSDGYTRNLIVDPAWYDAPHPLESLPRVEDPIGLYRPAPEVSKPTASVTVRFPRFDLESHSDQKTLQLVDDATHDFSTDTLKAALYSDRVDITTYSATDEVSSTGYTAGGEELTSTVSEVDGETRVTLDNVTWSGVSFTAEAVVIYNTDAANAVVGILYFGSPITVSGAFTLHWQDPQITMR